MKIVLVTETFPPEINGVAMTLERIVTALSKRGHEVMVVHPRTKHESSGSQPYQEWEVAGLPLPGYTELNFGLPCSGALRKAWAQDMPDIVHVATEGPLGWSAIRAAKALGIPVSSSFHTNFHAYSKCYGFGFLYQATLAYLRYIHNGTLATFAPSYEMLELLDDEGFRDLKLLGRGVDRELFSPSKRDEGLRQEWGAVQGEPVVLYVGRLAKEKNIPLSIQAFREMKLLRPELRMVVVGDGPERKKLEKKNPDVYFAGMQRGEALARHYASADLFVFASITETFGNVVTEAMASGLVVLTYDYAAGKAYIRSGENGFLAKYEDEESFLQAARYMVGSPDDWPAIAVAAREEVGKLPWSRIVDGFEDNLESLVQGMTLGHWDERENSPVVG